MYNNVIFICKYIKILIKIFSRVDNICVDQRSLFLVAENVSIRLISCTLTYRRHGKGTTQMFDKLFLTVRESKLQMESIVRRSQTAFTRIKESIRATPTRHKVTSLFFYLLL